jgi:hypothetical protein
MSTNSKGEISSSINCPGEEVNDSESWVPAVKIVKTERASISRSESESVCVERTRHTGLAGGERRVVRLVQATMASFYMFRIAAHRPREADQCSRLLHETSPVPDTQGMSNADANYHNSTMRMLQQYISSRVLCGLNRQVMRRIRKECCSCAIAHKTV